jgi:hypothetical protein
MNNDAKLKIQQLAALQTETIYHEQLQGICALNDK